MTVGSEQVRVLGVVAAATVVLDDDLIGGGTTHRDGLPGDEPEHVGPFGPLPNYQIR